MKADRDKLRRAFGLGRQSDAHGKPSHAPAEAPAPRSVPGEMLAFLQRRRERLAGPKPEPVALPEGIERSGPHGRYWLRELRYAAEFVHGYVPLRAALRLDGERLAALAKEPQFAALDVGHCLFLDTETTGLAGGAGTVVFAYGLGFWRGGELVFEQLFLRDFGEETAVLHHVAERMREFPVPVTFVGKSYDRHRIHARMAVHKVQAPVLTPLHLDLYYAARRAFGRELPDTRLRTVEERRLGLERQHDLPGSEAPAAFLSWVRDRSGPVDRVLEHNRLDVLSLVALLGVLAGVRPPA